MIHLPIAELTVNIFLLLGLGGLAGMLAGMFGIGGGFLLSPLLIFIGVPPSVAVATATNQVIASSVSGFLAHWHRQNVDIRMGLLLVLGGFIGAALGVWLFTALEAIGQIDLVISFAYVLFLGIIGTLMGVESLRALHREHHPEGAQALAEKRRISQRLQSARLPFQMHFPRSELTMSALLPVAVGTVTGILVSLMGIGGGFLLIPAMIYLLGMPASVVVGTSLFQIIFITSLVTVLHALNTQTVDIVLGMILIIGGVVGAQIGTILGVKVSPVKLRILLAGIVLVVALQLLMGLITQPKSLYTIERVTLEKSE